MFFESDCALQLSRIPLSFDGISCVWLLSNCLCVRGWLADSVLVHKGFDCSIGKFR